MLGLTNLFVSGKRLLAHSRARMTGGEIGRLFLDPLNMAVRQDTWDDVANPLYDNPAAGSTTRYCGGGTPSQPGCPSASERTLGNIIYDAKYEFTRNSPINNLTKVRLDVTWTEP